ncbi:MAG: nitroreductase family protein [Dehalococcoidales bacterium]
MEFFDVIEGRYSVRAYKSTPVEDEKLAKILEAAHMAPTACNLQPFQFIVIHTKGRETDLKHIYGQSWFTQAPLVICACAIPSQSWRRGDGKNYCDIDVTIAMDHLILAAANLGLGTCWIGAFDRNATCEILRLPEGVEPVAFTPVGYPADQPSYKTRKPVKEIVRYEKW